MASADPRIRFADDAALDPQLQVASAPFATWIGTIQVDADGAAHLLRSSGDEDRYPVDPATRAVIAGALDVEPQATAWLPVGVIYPVLEHLAASDAFDVASRMPAPRAEHVGLDTPAPVPIELRAALVDGVPGWCGAASRS
jgi:hypothetical protein